VIWITGSDKPNDTAGNEKFFGDHRGPLQIMDDVLALWEDESKFLQHPEYTDIRCPRDYGPAHCSGLKSSQNSLFRLFHACRESHEVVLRTHSPAFGAPGARAEIPFNFDADTLYIDWDVIVRIRVNNNQPDALGIDRVLGKKLALSAVIPETIQPCS
jgi:hypothetical protein